MGTADKGGMQGKTKPMDVEEGKDVAKGILLIYFHYELMISVFRVAWEVLTPKQRSNPDIVYVPLDAKTDIEITLLANMVSLTPGTLSLDLNPEKTHLIVHAMFARDHNAVISAIKNGLEKNFWR